MARRQWEIYRPEFDQGQQQPARNYQQTGSITQTRRPSRFSARRTRGGAGSRSSVSSGGSSIDPRFRVSKAPTQQPVETPGNYHQKELDLQKSRVTMLEGYLKEEQTLIAIDPARSRDKANKLTAWLEAERENIDEFEARASGLSSWVAGLDTGS
jgi:hypothetical protein